MSSYQHCFIRYSIYCIVLQLTLINEDIQLMPEFTIENVMQYFIHRKENDGLERQDWKNFDVGGYKLFKEGHVQKIYGSVSANMVLIKVTCLPEMKKDRTYVTGPAKINHVSTKKSPIFSSLLYHNLQIIYSNKIKSLSLLQNLLGFLLKFRELGYHIQS